MLMMNRASLARTAADCCTPFLVEQNYKRTCNNNYIFNEPERMQAEVVEIPTPTTSDGL